MMENQYIYTNENITNSDKYSWTFDEMIVILKNKQTN